MKISDTDRQIMIELQDGWLRASELAARVKNKEGQPINVRTIQRRAARLIERELVKRVKKGTYRLTEQGQVYLEKELLAVELGFGRFNATIKQLPSSPLQSFTRLLLSGLIAKAHLFDQYETGWPSFIIGGATKTGKTLIARLTERFLRADGLIKHVQTSTTGELIGRRFQTDEGWNFEPSPYFAGPFICLDELDKAQGELRRQALYYLQGDRSVLIEGEHVEVRPVPFVALNTTVEQGMALIPNPYLRRSIVVDTAPIRTELEDMDLVAYELFDGKPLPALNPKRVAPTKDHLTDEEFRLLRQLLKENVTDVGWGLMDTQPTVLLVLGCSALLKDIRESIYQTIYDRLICAETLGHTRPGWRGRLKEGWDSARSQRKESEPPISVLEPEAVPKPEAAPPETAPTARPPDKRAEKIKQHGDFIRRRSQTVEGFLLLRDRLMEMRGQHNKRITKGLRDQLVYFSKRTKGLDINDWEGLKIMGEMLEASKAEADGLHQRYQATIAENQARKDGCHMIDEALRHLRDEAKLSERLRDRKTTRGSENVIGALCHMGRLEMRTETRTQVIPVDLADVVTYKAVKFLAPIFYPRVRKEWEQNPPPEPQPQQVKIDVTYLLGCDGKRYRPDEVDCWEKPAVKHLLTLGLQAIHREIETLQHKRQALVEQPTSAALT
ncbi:MAG: hypothetical protein ACE5JU_18850 [Candidatus Binatia bacterium]